ncbi:MAG: hypothetical protein JW862_15670 [Anaerolineales bacterium]|nr:hypothetical protein [Anaerolineales bacterium]
MSTEKELVPQEEIIIEDSGQAIDMIQETMEAFLETADVSRVFGEPHQHEGTLIIPAAEVVAGLGFGAGYGSGGPENAAGGGGGGGGGGKTFARPVAVIIADQQGVRVEPVVDPTKIVLAFFTALGFIFATVAKMRRGS